jgi:hypothetical protein
MAKLQLISKAQFFSHFFVGCFESSRQICQLLWKQPQNYVIFYITGLSAASKAADKKK